MNIVDAGHISRNREARCTGTGPVMSVTLGAEDSMETGTLHTESVALKLHALIDRYEILIQAMSFVPQNAPGCGSPRRKSCSGPVVPE